jgi:pyruvate/2-oxoglutarate dehydrogenase complex dihydrolipoamide dehydrogenase (E3) component
MKANPVSFEKTPEGKIRVSWTQPLEGEPKPLELEEEFDTVLLAIGRTADTRGLSIDKAGVLLAKNG